MTHSHPSYPYVRRLLMAATMMSFAIGPIACKPKVGSQTKAIFSGGKGFALIPARRFTTTGGNGPEFENSIRMMMLPVKCTSESEVVTLENFALGSQDGARYSGRSILDTNGVPIPGTKSCAVLGNYALHFWAAQYLFPGNPKNDQEYHRQQWVYLALRGPYNKQDQGAKPPAVEKFFAEAGSVRLKGDLSMLALWDSFFNPCLPLDTAKVSGFDKKRHFKCEGTNYRSVSGNPDDATLSTLIANASDSLIYRMANGEFAPVNTAGLETAIRLYAPTGNALGLTGNTGKSASKTTAKGFFNGQRQPVRRFLFGQQRPYNTLSGDRYNGVPTRIQNPMPPVSFQPNVTTQNFRPTATPVPITIPTPIGQPVNNQNNSDSDSIDSWDKKIADWNQSGEVNANTIFSSNRLRFEELKDYAERSNRPISDIVGSGTPLHALFIEEEERRLQANTEQPLPSAAGQSNNFGEESERLQTDGYTFSDKYPGWLMKDGKDGTHTNYIGPNGEVERVVFEYDEGGNVKSSYWQVPTTPGQFEEWTARPNTAVNTGEDNNPFYSGSGSDF